MKLAPLVGIALAAAPVAADPLRLRADALATTASPAGLLVLEADGALRSGMSAEAVVWMAGDRTSGEGASGDVLVIAVQAQTKTGFARGKVGRFVSSLGALRPVHVDGGALRLRLPKRFDAEVFAGMPVSPAGFIDGRSWDWIAGGRVARRLGDYGSVGVGYAQRRDAGRLATEELGLDAGAAIDKRHDLGARLAYDLVTPGLAEVGVSASRRTGGVRTELYARHRSPSHLLPATSLFSVIGDVPSQRAGTVITWRAAPRLDLIADLAARRVDDEYGEELVGRARLRLDPRGASVVGGELRRSGGGLSAWTGVRALARIALPHAFAIATELELVIPDEDRGRGGVWPWGLVATTWERSDWQAAVAVEASASPEYRHRIDALFQLSRRWSVK
ncbi:MAG: hypothetical protein JWP01_97 [Myxococcales bacterium]|nr:hypothetical protein [Myxococcales bacterium]